MTSQVASLIRRSSRKQHGTENNRSWLSTCSQVIRPWHLKIQHGKPCHTFKKLDVLEFFGWTIQLHTSLNFLPTEVVIQLLWQEDCTQARFCAKLNITYHNGVPVEDILNLEHFHGPLTQICNNMLRCVFAIFFVAPTNLILITGKKSMVLFILSEIIDLKNHKKPEEIENFLP